MVVRLQFSPCRECVYKEKVMHQKWRCALTGNIYPANRGALVCFLQYTGSMDEFIDEIRRYLDRVQIFKVKNFALDLGIPKLYASRILQALRKAGVIEKITNREKDNIYVVKDLDAFDEKAEEEVKRLLMKALQNIGMKATREHIIVFSTSPALKLIKKELVYR